MRNHCELSKNFSKFLNEPGIKHRHYDVIGACPTLQAAEYGGAVKLVSSCGPAVGTCTFQGNNASSGGAVYVASYGSNGTCTDGDPCQCPPASAPVLTDVRLKPHPLCLR